MIYDQHFTSPGYGDIRGSVSDFTALRAVLGFEAKYSLYEGIADMISTQQTFPNLF
jgi:nucleoside-diphosphate-sugar epimerase